MNSTEANQTSPITCEVNYVQMFGQRRILLQRGSPPVKHRILGAKPAGKCKRVPVTIAFIDQLPQRRNFSPAKCYALGWRKNFMRLEANQ